VSKERTTRRELEQKNTWLRCALILFKLHELMIVMWNNFKKLNFGQLFLMKIIETAATRQHILKRQCTKFDFGWGLLHGKRSLGLQARRWYGQQIGLPICLFTSGEDGHFRFNHPAACTLLCTVRCSYGRCCSAVLQLQALAIRDIRFLVASR